MKCPILSAGEYTSLKCLERDCAWYDEEKGRCSLVVIARELSRIQHTGINVRVAGYGG